MRKNVRARGKISISRYMAEYNTGDKVALVAEPAVQKGLFHTRFYGLSGEVKGKRGRSYIIRIRDGGKEKTLIVPPIHLKKI